jgi:uncharacterized membrane protein
MKKKNTSLDLVTETHLAIKLDELNLKVDDKARLYRDQILTKLDQVMGKLQNIREDNIVGTHQVRQLRKDVENHSKRLVKLEQTPQIA